MIDLQTIWAEMEYTLNDMEELTSLTGAMSDAANGNAVADIEEYAPGLYHISRHMYDAHRDLRKAWLALQEILKTQKEVTKHDHIHHL